jgi:hypothetical protein
VLGTVHLGGPVRTRTVQAAVFEGPLAQAVPDVALLLVEALPPSMGRDLTAGCDPPLVLLLKPTVDLVLMSLELGGPLRRLCGLNGQGGSGILLATPHAAMASIRADHEGVVSSAAVAAWAGSLRPTSRDFPPRDGNFYPAVANWH